jgi:hypothetical protein
MGLLGKRKKDGHDIDLVALSTMGQQWGQPGHCPRCGHLGFLDRIDLVARDLYQHCPSCEHRWITAEQDLQMSSGSAR